MANSDKDSFRCTKCKRIVHRDEFHEDSEAFEIYKEERLCANCYYNTFWVTDGADDD